MGHSAQPLGFSRVLGNSGTTVPQLQLRGFVVTAMIRVCSTFLILQTTGLCQIEAMKGRSGGGTDGLCRHQFPSLTGQGLLVDAD